MTGQRSADGAGRFQLELGALYRVSYLLGSPVPRRVTRSIVTFGGATARRQWNGETVDSLEFARPGGRPLSLLTSQLLDARPAVRNDRGKVMLLDDPAHRRRRLSGRRMSRTA